MQRSNDVTKRPVRKNSRQADERYWSFIRWGHRASMAALGAFSLLLLGLLSSYAHRLTVRNRQ